MPLFRFDPSQLGFAADSWGRIGRNDFVPNINGRTGFWGVSGETTDSDDTIYDTPEAARAGGQLFNTQGEAASAAGAGLPGRSDSQNAYSASLAQQGIPESELPYGSGQMRTFLAQAGRGLPVADYLQKWARNTPGAWGQLGGRMMNERPAALSKMLGPDKDSWTEEQRKAALIDFLMRTYGGGQTGGSRIAE